jgi:exoribonuclease-2
VGSAVLTQGDIVEIKEKNRIFSGAVLTPGDKQILVLGSDRKEFKISPSKILFLNSGLNLEKGKDFLLSELKKIQEKRDSLKQGIQLKLLWEMVEGEENARSAEDLAELYFGSGCGSDEKAAMIRLLHEDFGYFRPRGNGFFPVDARTVKMMEESRSQQELHKQREEQFILWLSEKGVGEPPEGSHGFLEILKDFFIFENQSGKFKQAQSLLKKAKLTDMDEAFEILVQSSIFQENENLSLKRYRVPEKFSEKVEREAQERIKAPLLIRDYLDLTHLDSFSIDEETTSDIDDALSFEKVQEGFRVGVHIADVGLLVLKDSLLDKEAYGRSTSIYLPDRKIPMFPDSITEMASLVKDEKKPALSVLAVFDQKQNLVSWEIRETLIQVKRKLSYSKADQLIEQDESLSFLYQTACQFKEKRIQDGALVLQFPKVDIGVNRETGEISIKPMSFKSRSQILVSEWMVFANYLVGLYCSQNKIPALYRIQEAPSQIFSAEDGDWVNLYRQRKVIRKGEVSTQPSPHFGLGLKVYLQMSSPIRRYSDLVIHRQVKAFLNQELLPYSIEDLEMIRAYSDRWLEISDLVERDSKRYWLLKYLEKKIGERFEGIILDVHPSEYLILIPEFALEVYCARGMKDHRVGDEVEVVIQEVKPRSNVIKVGL